MSIQVFKYITKSITYDDIYKAIRLMSKQPIPSEIMFTIGRRWEKTRLVRALFGFEDENEP